MPKRYIDADKAIEAIEKTYGHISYVDEGFTRDDAKEIIRQQPTANVIDKEEFDRLLENATIIAEALNKYDLVEVKHGTWTKIGDRAYRCSVCNKVSCCMGNFCPDCGADMRGENE